MEDGGRWTVENAAVPSKRFTVGADDVDGLTLWPVIANVRKPAPGMIARDEVVKWKSAYFLPVPYFKRGRWKKAPLRDAATP